MMNLAALPILTYMCMYHVYLLMERFLMPKAHIDFIGESACVLACYNLESCI